MMEHVVHYTSNTNPNKLVFALVHNRYLHDFQVYLVVGLIIHVRGLIVFKPKLMLAFCLQPVEIARLLRSQI